MDVAWAQKILADFIDACESLITAQKLDYDDAGWDEARTRVDELSYPFTVIVQELNKPPAPARLVEFNPDDAPWSWLQTARRASGALEHAEDVQRMLRPTAPTLSADTLHSWVWDAAAPFWAAGQHAAAVEYGAKSLTAFIQQKSGSPLADRELVARVFSPKPSADRVRLWLPGERDTDTWRSRQEGLHFLSMGVYAGIRNVVAHTHETGWTQQEALEYLAALSVVARWSEETEVIRPEA